jgi:CDP-diacylglycerol--serine O-phosphatidyltransferase
VTAGNLLAGVVAISYLQDAAATADAALREALWAKAAWMIFLGMFCDGLDGRIARLTRSSSAFGTQLDSLADVVTFGVTPALLVKTIVIQGIPGVAPRLVLSLAGIYALFAALRLARYNVESARVHAGSAGHLTMVFRGLPSPAAAGVVASLVLLHHEVGVGALEWALLVAAPLLGVLMISRLPYAHVLNRWLDGSRPLAAVVLLALVLVFLLLYFHETVAAVFCCYALSGPVLWILGRRTGRPRWVEEEDEDHAASEAAPYAPGAPLEAPEPADPGRN